MTNREGTRFRWSADIVAWLILCVSLGGVSVLYLSLGLVTSESALIMPLDDTYIHFQYARQMAQGDPYVYNPGDEPSSGATSFLYTPLLAIGYWLGFDGLRLGYWAAVIGAVCFLLSGWLIYRLALRAVAAPYRTQRVTATLLMLAFVISGPMIWAAYSGMETLLMVLATLLALYAYSKDDRRGAGLAAAGAALVRPEGAVIAITMAFALLWRSPRRLLWPGVALATIAVQPLVNLMVTGSLSASGNQAKSHLYNVTIPFTERLEQIWDSWWRLWRELLSGSAPVDGHYIPVVVVMLGLVAVGFGIYDSWRRRDVVPALLAGSWLLLISIGIATLETAFWHFKRYQIPLMALMFPLGGWTLLRLSVGWWRWLGPGLAAGALIVSAGTTLEYARRYRDNVYVVQNQQIAMARWVAANLPAEARIGVHDVGVMRYVGNRATYDLVGLTTDKVATAWRQGSGTIYDTMYHHEHRPDYFAIYHDIQSLPLLAAVGVFGEELQRFTVQLPENTVASATGTQIVSRAFWPDDAIEPVLEGIPGTWTLHEVFDVGDIAAEDRYGYHWWQDGLFDGFATIVRRLPLATCMADECLMTDGQRRITGGEEWTLPDAGDADYYLVVLRAHAESPAYLFLGCDAIRSTKVVPQRPGLWVEIPFLLPAEAGRFCLKTDQIYHPATYTVYTGDYPAIEPPEAVIARLVDPVAAGRISLVDVSTAMTDAEVAVSVQWFSQGDLTQDGKVFLHLYDHPDEPPLRQIDVWPQDDTLPPANWLPGYMTEVYRLSLDGLPPGTYPVALGMFEPNTGKRYTVVRGDGRQTDRLFVGEVQID
ncbi:MAG: hypothetical protein GYB66_14185 [Chloroflexi bacterium]|nr:hypothetical protein [Chloroflexota bacterium]